MTQVWCSSSTLALWHCIAHIIQTHMWSIIAHACLSLTTHSKILWPPATLSPPTSVWPTSSPWISWCTSEDSMWSADDDPRWMSEIVLNASEICQTHGAVRGWRYLDSPHTTLDCSGGSWSQHQAREFKRAKFVDGGLTALPMGPFAGEARSPAGCQPSSSTQSLQQILSMPFSRKRDTCRYRHLDTYLDTCIDSCIGTCIDSWLLAYGDTYSLRRWFVTWCYIRRFERDVYDTMASAVRCDMVTSGVSFETSLNKHGKPHLHREYIHKELSFDSLHSTRDGGRSWVTGTRGWSSNGREGVSQSLGGVVVPDRCKHFDCFIMEVHSSYNTSPLPNNSEYEVQLQNQLTQLSSCMHMHVCMYAYAWLCLKALSQCLSYSIVQYRIISYGIVHHTVSYIIS